MIIRDLISDHNHIYTNSVFFDIGEIARFLNTFNDFFPIFDVSTIIFNTGMENIH